MPNLLTTPQQPIVGVSLYLNSRISMNTKANFILSSDRNSYKFDMLDAFCYYLVLHRSPRNDAVTALNVSFDHWSNRFGMTDISVTDNKNDNINSDSNILSRLRGTN